VSDIDHDDIRRLDGGLLLVFRELCRRGRTTAVAAHLGLSQSAVSHALSRLRDVFGDPLFLRRPHGLEPTPRAQALAPRIEALIEAMGAALRPEGAAAFDPGRSGRWFHVAASEYADELIGARLAARLHDVAGAVFTLRFTRAYLALEDLRRGRIDLVLGRFEALPAGLVGEVLYEDRYCIAARRGHPVIDGRISLAQWREAGHVWVAALSSGDDVVGPAVGEDPLPNAGEARAAALVPRWETALTMVAASDAICSGPRRFAEARAETLGLQVLEPPVAAYPPWRLSMVRRAGPDAGLDWFCGEVRAAALATAPQAPALEPVPF
jgi:DNA-binding transcriptional LysR family regulator